MFQPKVPTEQGPGGWVQFGTFDVPLQIYLAEMYACIVSILSEIYKQTTVYREQWVQTPNSDNDPNQGRVGLQCRVANISQCSILST